MAPTPAAVAKEIQKHFALQAKRAAWSDLMLSCGLSRVGLSEEEWCEFLRVCSESGVTGDGFATFRNMIKLMDRHGDDGYGDKPSDMSRIVYWFQHVAPVTRVAPGRDRSRSPHRDV